MVAFDIDGDGAADAVENLGDRGVAVGGDVTSEDEVRNAFGAAIDAFGGVDIVVSNAGIASSAPIEDTTLAEWNRNQSILGTGYFLVAREAFRVLRTQDTGGSVVFVASKNALVAGQNAAAYSSAKAAELHLARCLAEEGGAGSIRVNTVNPDAVLHGSRIWDSSWREERAAAYGIAPEDLEEHYRNRTVLGVHILPDDIAQAVMHFASPVRSGRAGQPAQRRRRRHGGLSEVAEPGDRWSFLCEPTPMRAGGNGKRPAVPAERRRLILELLREQGSVSVATVEEEFRVSPMTARRDLALLADAGYARRTHGGAVLPELAAHEDSFQSRLEQDVEAKVRLAKAVVATLETNETVFIDSSSSAYYVVREILDAGLHMTLLTNSVPVMAYVGSADAPQVDLIGLGGSYRKLTRSFVGAQTVRAIESFFADRIVFSVKGIEREGFLTDPDPLEAEVKRTMIGRARTVSLIADAHKFDERGLNVIVPASAVAIAYLADPPAAGVRVLEGAGVEVNRV